MVWQRYRKTIAWKFLPHSAGLVKIDLNNASHVCRRSRTSCPNGRGRIQYSFSIMFQIICHLPPSARRSRRDGNYVTVRQGSGAPAAPPASEQFAFGWRPRRGATGRGPAAASRGHTPERHPADVYRCRELSRRGAAGTAEYTYDSAWRLMPVRSRIWNDESWCASAIRMRRVQASAATLRNSPVQGSDYRVYRSAWQDSMDCSHVIFMPDANGERLQMRKTSVGFPSLAAKSTRSRRLPSPPPLPPRSKYINPRMGRYL